MSANPMTKQAWLDYLKKTFVADFEELRGMTRKNRLQCWALRMRNGQLVGRQDRAWYEAYKVLTFRTRKAATQYAMNETLLANCMPVKIRIETYTED
jgi:hypothetical protein